MPPLNINIREARVQDCAEMMALVHELAVYERAPDEVTVTLDHFRESGFGKEPVWWAYVATVEDQEIGEGKRVEGEGTRAESIIGFALYYIRYSTWKGKKMYLEDIIVTEPWRGKGIGTMLMHELIRVAREKEFQGITWQVLEWNEPALNFYRRFDAHLDAEWVNAGIDFR